MAIKKNLKISTLIAVMLLTVAAIMGTVTNAQGSVILQDGFETDFSNWTTQGAPTIVSTPTGVNGSYIAQLPIDSSSYLQYSYTPTSTATIDFFFRIDTINMTAGSTLKIAEILDQQTSSPITRLFVSCNGTGDLGWRLIGIGSTMDVFVPEGITQGVWYRITETLKTGATDGACQLWIDSELVYSGSNLAFSSPSKAINLGCLLGFGYTTGNMYLDTVTVSDSLDPLPTPSVTASPSPSPTDAATATPAPTDVPTVVPTAAPTATLAPTSTATVPPTTQSTLSLPVILTIIVVVVVVVVIVVLLVMRKRKSGADLPPPPPPPT